MPTLKAIHICNLHKPKLQPKIAKENVFANASNRTKIKYDRTTTPIRNTLRDTAYSQTVSIHCGNHSSVIDSELKIGALKTNHHADFYIGTQTKKQLTDQSSTQLSCGGLIRKTEKQETDFCRL